MLDFFWYLYLVSIFLLLRNCLRKRWGLILIIILDFRRFDTNVWEYAHKDIAFEFGSAISVPFKLYLIEEFQRLKTEELQQLGWSAKRELSKINYHIHTDAIKQNLIPAEVTPKQASVIYANEADVLNVAIFGMMAKQWREANPELKGNIRDYATINELICLSNMENLNAVFIEQGVLQWRIINVFLASMHCPVIAPSARMMHCIFSTEYWNY